MNSVYSMCPHDEHRAAVLFSAWPETKKDIRWTQRTAFASLCLCKFNLIKSSRDTHFAYGPYRISSASAQQRRTFCIICNHIECTKILSIVYAADKQTKNGKIIITIILCTDKRFFWLTLIVFLAHSFVETRTNEDGRTGKALKYRSLLSINSVEGEINQTTMDVLLHGKWKLYQEHLKWTN